MNNEQKLAEIAADTIAIQKHIFGMSQPRDSLGERIVKSDMIQGFLKGSNQQATLSLTQREIKTAILGTHAQNDPLGFATHPTIAPGARRKLFIRDLLLAARTEEAAVEYPTETSFTNNAGIQVGGSPEAFQNVSLGESGFTFDLTFQPVKTIGHFIHVSKQVLKDSPVLNAFLQNRLLYGVRIAEENQILNGTGSNGQLNGLLTNATAYTVQSPQLTNEVDIIRNMITQVEVADFSPDAIVLNPQDWRDIDLRKSGATNDEYIAGDPRTMNPPALWGLPVIVTNSIASGTCLVGDFSRGAALFDRQDPLFQVSNHNDTNFQKSMVTLKVDERVSLVVSNPLALVTGSI